MAHPLVRRFPARGVPTGAGAAAAFSAEKNACVLCRAPSSCLVVLVRLADLLAKMWGGGGVFVAGSSVLRTDPGHSVEIHRYQNL